ncbi:MAG: hypothetical protein ACE5PV_05050, partial [Candidatus Poribacteria bacterium]
EDKMRGSKLLLLIGLVVAIAGSIIFIQQTSVRGQEKAVQPVYIVQKPPASLDQYYPPKTEAPQYLFAMLTMDGQITGIMTHITDGDLAKAQEYFKTFEVEYQKLAKMVPEWSHYWAQKPLGDLSAALKSGEQEKIGTAMTNLTQVCIQCHQENMPAVWARYQKSIEQIEVQDTVSLKKMKMGEFMFALAGSLGAVNTYLTEGKFDKSGKALEDFQKRIDALSKSCNNCHETERAYYVGPDVQALLKTASEALKEEKPNVEQIAGAMQKVGTESCYECHKVHMPAHNIQKAWAAEK